MARGSVRRECWPGNITKAFAHETRATRLDLQTPAVGLPIAIGMHAGLGRDHAAARRYRSWGLALEREGFAIGEVEVAPLLELLGDSREASLWSVGLSFDLVPDRLSFTVTSERPVDGSGAPKVSVSLTLAFP